ncbi:MAG: bifunctional alpha/beta hydrolase/class I SAM-dependent methyltransferase [Elusimicrobia bacterium]|nr:bifunctional alpha/beta hydrolase/class I SAM-dependent methyltransferase [Elusimicrobiota bacterium]
MSLTLSEHRFTSWDGLSIFYRAWHPLKKADRAIVVFHRGHEHSGRWTHLVDTLAPAGFAVFAWDARGNGLSEGPRDDAPHFTAYTKDADAFVRHLSRTENIPIENMAVVGHSVGGAVAAAWAHDFAPKIRALVLGTPAFRIKLYFPFAVRCLRVALKLGLMKTVPSYVKARVLTHDPEEIRRYNKDPLISHSISTRILLDLFDTSARVIEDAAAIRIPTLLLVGQRDWVVEIGAERRFFQRLGSPVKKLEWLPHMFHDIFHETDRSIPLTMAREFIENSFTRQSPPLLLDADRRGATRDEYDRLSKPLPKISLRHWGYAGLRGALKSIGRLSQGIRLGWESGFNSGRTLEYVYRNTSQGLSVLGRAMDRLYLNGVGWRGIRVRGQQIERLIARALVESGKKGHPVHLVDIACGGGRYVLRALKEAKIPGATALLRDREPKNLEEARRLSQEWDIPGVAVEQADAFDEKSLARLAPPPRVAVVSGLYELFADNGPVLASLRGLAAAVPQNGYLVYTNQPWHPQLELIARVLCDWDGRPWIMRRRTQEEMDDLVRSVGFEKIDIDIDPWGIFTVSLAVRRWDLR